MESFLATSRPRSPSGVASRLRAARETSHLLLEAPSPLRVVREHVERRAGGGQEDRVPRLAPGRGPAPPPRAARRTRSTGTSSARAATIRSRASPMASTREPPGAQPRTPGARSRRPCSARRGSPGPGRRRPRGSGRRRPRWWPSSRCRRTPRRSWPRARGRARPRGRPPPRGTPRRGRHPAAAPPAAATSRSPARCSPGTRTSARAKSRSSAPSRRIQAAPSRKKAPSPSPRGSPVTRKGSTRARARRACVEDHRVVGVDHRPVRLDLPGEDPGLGRDVALEGGVTVEVVGGEVEPDRDVGVEAVGALELEARDLDREDRLAPSSPPRSRSGESRCCRPPGRRAPAASRTAPRPAVVVDLPLVPVMAARRPRRWRKASSISAITSTPASRAACSSGRSHGTPGDTTTIEAPAKVSGRCPPSSRRIPFSRSLRTSSGSWSSVLRSVATTEAPRRARNSAAATPDRASPTTTTETPSSSTSAPVTAASAWSG